MYLCRTPETPDGHAINRNCIYITNASFLKCSAVNNY